jgi:hypothetical protein
MTKQLNFWHNSIQALPSEHREKEKKAINQNEKILDLFRQNKYTDFTPAEVFLRFGQQIPLTSIRRAISDLTKAGELVKTENKRKGLFNESNNAWKLNLKK